MIDFISNIHFDLNDIISFLTSLEVQKILFPIKMAFLAVSGLLLATIIFNLMKTHYTQWLFLHDVVQFFTMKPVGAKTITRQWNKVLSRLETGAESEYKLAVIEADDLLDASLKKMGYTGNILEERLGKLTSATLPNIEQLYEVHRLRDNIVHDPDYRFTLDEVKKAMDVYNKAFIDLQILEK